MNKNQYKGLSNEEVLKSREQYGENILTPPQKEPLWKLFLEKFDDPIIRILIIAALLSLLISFVHNEYLETIGIFCAIFLATGVSFWFERDANKKFDLLNKVTDEEAILVIRDGHVTQVSKKDIVVGDIVLLETGNEIPADGELLEATSLQIDESTLTGEPMIDKTVDPEHFEEGVTYPSNYVLRSTKVIGGHGVFRVDKVGDATEFGQVATKATEKVEGQTPLNRQLEDLAKFIGMAGYMLALLTFSILLIRILFFNPEVTLLKRQIALLLASLAGGVLALGKIWSPLIFDGLNLINKNIKMPKSFAKMGWFTWIISGFLLTTCTIGIGALLGVDPLNPDSWISIDVASEVLQAFMVAVTLVVVAVPEGLPMSVTLSLALSMRRMLNTNNLVRKMHACETMGATTVICTDKTGTLTQNQMRVYRTNIYAIKQDDSLSDDEVSNLIKESIALNSTAFLDKSNEKSIQVLGNPTEGALLLWLNDLGIDYENIRLASSTLQELPFSTERKMMGILVHSPSFNKKILYIKGAPEVILSKCSDVLTETGKDSVNKFKPFVEDQLYKYQNQAMRTLGFAYKIVEDEEANVDCEILSSSGMTFLGIAAISDPVRPDVPAAVQECLGAGVKVKIVTGDIYGTAKEIARQIGIWDDDFDTEEQIISGVDFEALSDEEALKRVTNLKIMCRARPTDKQRLVKLLKQTGEIVAVTGDGTNDAPALNYADVGLSMGTGTSVAKEASDITLLDDSFASIATAIMWGRSLYHNIQRFLLFQLTINVAALLIVFLGSVFGNELPLTVTQMLWVNLIMDTFAAGALASLPPNPGVMKEMPRKNTDFIVKRPIAIRILAAGFSFVIVLLGFLWYMGDPEHLNSFFNYVAAEDRERYFLSYFFTFFVMLQFWNMFNAKAYDSGKFAFSDAKKSTAFWLVAALILVGQVIIVSFGGDVFRTMPLLLRDWIIIIASTSIVLWIGEISRFRKYYELKKGNN